MALWLPSTQLANAFALVSEYTNTSSGVAPGPALPSGYYSSSKEINTLGNIAASCINSTGGAAGDGSACGNFFALAEPSASTAPTDTIGALLDILNNPSQNVADLYSLSGAVAPFQPTVSSAPTTWNLPIVAIPATPTFTPAPGTYASGGLVELDDSTPGTTIYYTTDGSTPTTSSAKYTGAISVASTETIQAIATASGNTNSAVGLGTYTITGSGGNPTSTVVAVSTNANGNITSIPPADGGVNATFTYNNANRLLSVTGSPLAATFVYDWSGQRFSKANPGTSPTIYSYAEGGTLIAENDGGTVTDYIYADGRPIATIQPTASPAANQVNYILADHLGTPQLASNSGGATVWSTTYPPFGTTGVINAVTNQNLRFPGQYNDTETGFNYNLNRDYMPNLGRYIEADPIGLQGGVNVYSYARANPARFIDRFGLQLAEPDLSQDDIFSDDYNEDLKRSLEDMGQYVVDLEDTAQKIGDAAATPTVCSIATASNASTDSEIAPFPPLWLPTAQQASFQKSLLKMLAPQIRRRRYDPGEIQ